MGDRTADSASKGEPRVEVNAGELPWVLCGRDLLERVDADGACRGWRCS